MTTCSWLEPGRNPHKCGEPAVVVSRYGDGRCKRHAPPKPWDAYLWQPVKEEVAA